MAQLNAQEFTNLITRLVEQLGLAQFHAKLMKANALVSRKRPADASALATQLYQLSAGLRREHAARYAVEMLWQEMLSSKMDEERSATVEALAEGVNACLSERLEVVPDKQADLLAALGAYYRALAASSSEETAYLEMLLRASTSVAQFLRQHKDELSAAVEESVAATGEKTEG